MARTLKFFPLTFMAGPWGFVLFVPWLLGLLGVMGITARARRGRRSLRAAQKTVLISLPPLA
ncbi:MAG TPA: hypothetical protein VL992_07000 [Tepidisphaeraceae bacterium]|nr:hypothetical protein [Tepidisphaeraceae bacterium]